MFARYDPQHAESSLIWVSRRSVGHVLVYAYACLRVRYDRFMNATPDPPLMLGSARYEEQLPSELAEEWDAMDETEAANEEYEFDLMQRDD
jgi:hypothetical protein